MWVAVLLLAMTGCAPYEQAVLPEQDAPRLMRDAVIASDGAQLPVQQWVPRKPKAMVVALHGFNDYRHAFALPGKYFSRHRIGVVAYDQRGFGTTQEIGTWAGEENLLRDVRDVVMAVKEKYPRTPIYLLGESMGGAVAISAQARYDLPVKGIILVAPAVWADSVFPWPYRAVLWTSAHTFPEWKLTGEDLKIVATDNMEVLREMVRDPHIIKATRVDAIYGLVGIMDRALTEAPKLDVPILLLHGDRDEVIARESIDTLEAELPPHEYRTYSTGYHMLLRDLQARSVWQDIRSWIDTNY